MCNALGTYVHATTYNFVIAHHIHVIYILLAHFKIFQLTRFVRQFDFKKKLIFQDKQIFYAALCIGSKFSSYTPHNPWYSDS